MEYLTQYFIAYNQAKYSLGEDFKLSEWFENVLELDTNSEIAMNLSEVISKNGVTAPIVVFLLTDLGSLISFARSWLIGLHSKIWEQCLSEASKRYQRIMESGKCSNVDMNNFVEPLFAGIQTGVLIRTTKEFCNYVDPNFFNGVESLKNTDKIEVDKKDCFDLFNGNENMSKLELKVSKENVDEISQWLVDYEDQRNNDDKFILSAKALLKMKWDKWLLSVNVSSGQFQPNRSK